jgi:hypothetical protein
MRRMSFALTMRQVRDRSKTVTRRMGWPNLKRGERFAPIEKCQGLRKGERQVVIVPKDAAPILECLTNDVERLGDITQEDVIREGFPEFTPAQFVEMFCRSHKEPDGSPVTADSKPRRIAFRYVAVDCRCYYLAPEQREGGVMCTPCHRVNE